MPKIPKPSTTHQIINSQITPGRPSRRLGLSKIGELCERKLWYSLHWASFGHIPARSQRIFTIGNVFEEIAIKDLKRNNIKCYRKDNKDKNKIVEIFGKQDEEQEEFSGFVGHAVGKIDGRGMGFVEYPNEELMMEFKTMADKYFAAIVKDGLRKSNPVYFAQVQRYMRGIGLDKTFFMAINKNDCSYYIEFVHHDPGYSSNLEKKEQRIIMSDAPPEKYYASDNYNCNFCNHRAVCHDKAPVQDTCRLCAYADMDSGGKWICTNRNKFDEDKVLDLAEQSVGCNEWELGWGIGEF